MGPLRRKILIVDDNIANLTVGRNLLKAYYDVYLAPSAAQMFDMLPKVLPDLILLDIEMPETDGYEAIARLKADRRFAGVPVIFLTAQNTEESELKGFELGAVDYINKPFSPPLLLKRIEHQLTLVIQSETIQYHMDNLSALVSEKVGEVLLLQNAILGTVADLVEFRDRHTGGHIARTQMYLKAIIDGLSGNMTYTRKMAGWDMDSVLQSAQLHDVGKIAIPDAVLNKPGRLTADEFNVMKMHVTAGVDIVNKIISKTKSHAFLRHALHLIGSHHEKWDGSGYPYGLKGEDIPLEGRLMAVADVYDALVSWRPYKEKMTHEQAAGIIREGRGTHFDPVLVDAFLATKDTFEKISSSSGECDSETPEWSVLTLTKDMEIGVPEVDAQHRELIDRLNNVITIGVKSIDKEEAQGLLDFLGDYVVEHFNDEEALQKQSGYPKYEWHKNQHQAFIAKFQKLKKDFAGSRFSAERSLELSKTVVDWVLNHIKTVDVEFGTFYQMRRALETKPPQTILRQSPKLRPVGCSAS